MYDYNIPNLLPFMLLLQMMSFIQNTLQLFFFFNFIQLVFVPLIVY